MNESVLTFGCEGEHLVGLLSVPAGTVARTGVVIIVGGPQYRAGSHRQFTLLARHLATQGFATLRFDYRSMGDSSGSPRDFLGVESDIAAAIQALTSACPGVTRVVLWGLCDGASAALLYVEARPDSRIAGLALANPWVRSAASLAQTHLKHYYVRRLLQAAFWRKLVSGGVGLGALSALLRNVRDSRRADQPDTRSYQQRMAAGWGRLQGPILLLLSGDDYTAKEFLGHTGRDTAWRGLLERGNVSRLDLPGADHTFSASADARKAEAATLAWLREVS